jgi:hypothetical protein
MEDSDDLVWWWLVLGPLAMAVIAGCVVVGVATFVPGPLPLPEWLDAVFGLAAVPVLLATVVTGRRMQRRRRRILDEIESVAPAAWPTALFVLVGFGVLVVAAAGGPNGEPEQLGDQYVLRYQGEITAELTRDEYVRYENLDRRRAAGALGALHTPGLTFGLYALARHRQARQTVGP